MLKVLLVIGTRPEAIKLAPLVRCLRQSAGSAQPLVCLSGQHPHLVAPILEHFEIDSDETLDVMRPGQSLASLTGRFLEGLDDALLRHQPDCIVVQGDTTTTMAASLAAFYRHMPVVHVEAGLRTGNLRSPWPEEMNRRVATLTAALHCAPTQQAADNLLLEGVPEAAVHVTGNTVIDALLWTLEKQSARPLDWEQEVGLRSKAPLVLITGHRRENWGSGIEQVCRAIRALAESRPEVDFVFPLHVNPLVREPVCQFLGDLNNVRLIDAAPYPLFVGLMHRSKLIITDSGGVQEEAPSLDVPVLVTRDTTERPEAVAAGAAQLVGTSQMPSSPQRRTSSPLEAPTVPSRFRSQIPMETASPRSESPSFCWITLGWGRTPNWQSPLRPRADHIRENCLKMPDFS